MEPKEQHWETENWNIWQACYNKARLDVNPTDGIEVLASRSGLPTAKFILPAGRAVFVHSSADPVKEAQRVAAGLSVDAATALVVFGFGFGYFIEALLDMLDENIALFVVEPNKELFCEAMKHRDLRSLLDSKRVYLLVSDSPEEFQMDFGKFYNPARNKLVEIIGLPGHIGVYPEFRTQLDRSILDVLNAHQIHLNTIIKIGPKIITNGILNLVDYYCLPGVASLFNKFMNVPAIIVSAGPSLNKNIQLLQEVKGKAVILAVGTAVKALEKVGIYPDFVLSIDPGETNCAIFSQIETEKTCLITEMQSHYQIIKQFKGPKFVMGSTPVLEWYAGMLEEKGDTESGGSVANNAVSAAYKMGMNPIVLVGQDLAYSRDGHTHATGTHYENNIISGNEQRGYFWIKANEGGQVQTDRAFYLYLRWFETWFKEFPDRDYINATEGGAFIEGTKIMTLREVVNQYCTAPVDVQQIIRNEQQSFTAPSLKSLLQQLQIQKKKLETAILHTTKAITELDKLEAACEGGHSSKIKKHFNSICKTYKEFSTDAFLSVLPDWFDRHEMHRILYRTYEAEINKNDDFHAAIDDYRIYYEKMKEGARRAKELIEVCIRETERRIDDDQQSL